MLTSQLIKNMFNKLKKIFKPKPKKDMLYCGRCDHEWDSGIFTNIYQSIEGCRTLVLNCPKCHPQVTKDIAIKDVDERLDKLSQGERIKAVIRHRNANLGLPDSYVLLTNEEDGFLTYDYSELNHQWEIIDFEVIDGK